MQSTFTPYQKFVVAALAFLQFTIILDFMILAPLGAILMPALSITPSQFGFVVSIYAFSAGASGILSAGFADRFDRKKLLLFFYTGFIIGTLLCGIAPSYSFLLVARMITGIFGGVIGSVVMAITTDLFPFEMRGRVMGLIQSAFAGSQILGLPLGLYLASHFGWHMPFLLIVGFSVIAGLLIFSKLKPIRDHLGKKIDVHAFHHLVSTISNPDYLKGFAATIFLATGGYMLMPFSSAFMVHNVGISMDQLPTIYMVTGFSSIFTGPLIGRLADRIGKFKVFLGGTTLSMIMIAIYTHMGPLPLGVVTTINAVLFMGIFSRMIPAQALQSAIPSKENRGSFMAVNVSIQQISGGLASMIAGLIVTESATGTIEHFDKLGYCVLLSNIAALFCVFRIHQMVKEKLA